MGQFAARSSNAAPERAAGTPASASPERPLLMGYSPSKDFPVALSMRAVLLALAVAALAACSSANTRSTLDALSGIAAVELSDPQPSSSISSDVLVYPYASRSGCVCACVDGGIQPVCSSAYMTEFCSPRICPVPLPYPKPPMPPVVEPPGVSTCFPAQVAMRGEYKWTVLCR